MIFSFRFYKIIILIFFAFCFNAKAQSDTGYVKVSDNYYAQNLFIEGKILELQYNYVRALENYRTALNYDKSPGIYFAISNIYYETERYLDALTEINNALKLARSEIKYLEHKGHIYYKQENYQKAAEIFEDIIKLDSNYSYGLYFLARIYQELKLPSKAIIIYEKIIDNVGFDFEILRRMYEIYYEYKNYTKCVEVLEYALKLDPYDQLIRQQLANLYLKTGEADKSQKIYEELFELNPGDPVLQSEMIKIYFKTNQGEKGFKLFAKGIKKDSLGFDEKMQLGEMYYKMLSSDSTVIPVVKSIFSSIASEYPEQWLPYFFIGSINYFLKNYSDADDNFAIALKNGDTVSKAFIQVGYIYVEYGNYEKAKTILEKGITKFPEQYLLYYFYGISFQREGNIPEAIKYYEKALNLENKDVSLLSTLALAYHSQKMYKESEEIYEMALKLEPDNALILNNYAYNLSQRGINLEKALVMSQRSLEKEPENASYLDTFGWIYFKMKNYELAEKFILKSLSKNASSAAVTDHLGDIYFAKGDLKNALKYWNKALELSPKSIEIKQKIEKYSN
jgi:tetratricopeptide (TPR) repeat protein